METKFVKSLYTTIFLLPAPGNKTPGGCGHTNLFVGWLVRYSPSDFPKITNPTFIKLGTDVHHPEHNF